MLTDKLLPLLIRSFNAFIVAYCCVSFPVGDTSLTGLIEVLVCLHLSWQVKPLEFFVFNIANLSRDFEGFVNNSLQDKSTWQIMILEGKENSSSSNYVSANMPFSSYPFIVRLF